MFPKWYIVLLALSAFFVLGDIFGLIVVEKGPTTAATQAARARNLLQVAVGCAIWGRVRLTFVQ
jgi:hypothetical protein